jgi:hypothetical protein
VLALHVPQRLCNSGHLCTCTADPKTYLTHRQRPHSACSHQVLALQVRQRAVNCVTACSTCAGVTFVPLMLSTYRAQSTVGNASPDTCPFVSRSYHDGLCITTLPVLASLLVTGARVLLISSENLANFGSTRALASNMKQVFAPVYVNTRETQKRYASGCGLCATVKLGVEQAPGGTGVGS